jgi:hypothetical protein
MRKTLRTITLVLCVLLCVAMTAVWVRSYFFGDSVIVTTSNERSLSVMSQPGCMLWTFGWTTREPVQSAGWHWRQFEWGKPPDPPPDENFTYGPVEPYWPQWIHYGFGMYSEVQTINPAGIVNYDGKDRTPYEFHYVSVALPHWLIVLLAALWPLRRAYVFARARRRKSSGLCPSCGYDLRAGHGTCPECGSPILRLLMRLLGRRVRPSPPMPPLAA